MNLLPLRLLAGGITALLLVSSLTAIAATNTVPPTRAETLSRQIGINDLRPSACATISMANLVIGSGNLTGSPANDLILGSAGDDSIDGLGGNDCIIGGGGQDTIIGGEGTDICVGGPGEDMLVDCEGEIP